MKKNYDSKSHFSKSSISLQINVCTVLKYLLICIIFFAVPSKSFPQNVSSSDLICSKANKNSKDSVQNSKEIIWESFPVPKYIPNEKQAVLWINPNLTENDTLPDPNEFIQVFSGPKYDLKELQRNIIFPDHYGKIGIEGRVILRVLIDTTGCILKIICESTDNDILTQSALDAVLKTKFTPAYQDKKPILCWISVPVNITIR